jgi:nitroimidazol reductase NimA-like FMN-containing flavoprotein (pyridoxamine 5'-phosphate oxidase superfamily)
MNEDARQLANPGLRSLSDSECWRLLGSQDLGRIAIVIDGWPQVFPVNYAAEDRTILFRTGRGAKLEHGRRSRVCFEVDGWDDRTGIGWSVMVQGVIREITDDSDQGAETLRQLSVHPAAPGLRPYLLALFPSRVSGRRFGGPGMIREMPFTLSQ